MTKKSDYNSFIDALLGVNRVAIIDRNGHPTGEVRTNQQHGAIPGQYTVGPAKQKPGAPHSNTLPKGRGR
jgi:hypothetical protein